MTKEEFESIIIDTSLRIDPHEAEILRLVQDLDIRLRKIENKEK